MALASLPARIGELRNDASAQQAVDDVGEMACHGGAPCRGSWSAGVDPWKAKLNLAETVNQRVVSGRD